MSEFSSDVQVRFRDIDAMGHVNNAVSTVLASLELSYERPILLEQSVSVTIEIPELGRSSLPMEYEILADGERAATARSVQVFLDPETGESSPIPERFRERITEFEGL